jgi:hypothetical protein
MNETGVTPTGESFEVTCAPEGSEIIVIWSVVPFNIVAQEELRTAHATRHAVTIFFI